MRIRDNGLENYADPFIVAWACDKMGECEDDDASNFEGWNCIQELARGLRKVVGVEGEGTTRDPEVNWREETLGG